MERSLDERAEKIDAEKKHVEAHKATIMRELAERKEVEARAQALDLQAKALNECSEQIQARKAELEKREAELNRREAASALPVVSYAGAVVVGKKRPREIEFARVTQVAEEWAKISQIEHLSQEDKLDFKQRLFSMLDQA